MTIQEQQANAEAALQLWKAVLPEVEPPAMYRFVVWTSNFPTAAVTRGISRASAKYYKMASTSTPMTPGDTARYCSSVIRRESETI